MALINFVNETAFLSPCTLLSNGVYRNECLQRLRKPVRRVRTPNVHRVKCNVWSDPAVTQEYMDFLSGENQRELASDCASTIVGHGRLGNFIRSQGDGSDVVVLRGECIPDDAPGPVYLCTRNDELEGIIQQCPASKREDLVFMQNGMLEPLQRKYGLTENTRANIYFAVSKFGADPIDGKTILSPDGLTSVTGKWEGALQARLHKAGLSCKLQKERDFRRANLEKLIWIAAFNLVGAAHGGISMGEVADHHESEITNLCQEMAGMVRFSLTVGMLPDIEKRLLAYARSVKDFPTAIKEFSWRNGYFYAHSQMCLKNGFPDPTPMHT